MPDDKPDDVKPEDTVVTCAGGITIPPLGVADGAPGPSFSSSI